MANSSEKKRKKPADLTAQILSVLEQLDQEKRDEVLYFIKRVGTGREAKALLETLKSMRLTDAIEHLRNHPPSAEITMLMIVLATSSTDNERGKAEADLRSEVGKKAADDRHNQQGGYRQKKEELQKAWATGEYITKKACAEAKHISLGVVFDKAREYLSGIPDPDPWPAKFKKAK